MKTCQQLVFMDEFEYTSTIVTALNLVPIFMNFVPNLIDNFLTELRISNYYFLSLYILEAMMKVYTIQCSAYILIVILTSEILFYKMVFEFHLTNSV